MVFERAKDNRLSNKVIILVVLMTIVSLYLKIYYLNYWSGDFDAFLTNWIAKFREHGGLGAFRYKFYNYTPPYMYFLGLLSYINLKEVEYMYVIKIFSILFEYLCAFFIGKIALHITKNRNYFYLALGIVPLIPTVILNSAFMAQCDAIYVSMMLGSCYFLLCKKNTLVAMIFLGLAFSLKLQASVILPFYFLYMLRGNIKWYYFFIVPVVYLLVIIPAWLCGAEFMHVLTIYSVQSAYSYELSSFFPNVYYLGLSNVLGVNKIPGMVFVFLLTLVVSYLLMNKKYKFSTSLWFHFIFLSALVCPYFLPGMRERYLYFGDILVVLYVMLYPKNYATWLVAIGVWFVSFFGYALSLENIGPYYDNSGFDHSYFAMLKVIKWKIVCLLYLAIIVYVAVDFTNRLKANSKKIFS